MSEEHDEQARPYRSSTAVDDAEMVRRFDRALQMMQEGLDERKAAGLEEDPRPGLIILPPRQKPQADTDAGESSPQQSLK